MAGPFADYWIATPNKLLTTNVADVAKFKAPNVVTGMVGLLQVQVHTENTNGLQAVLKINGENVFTYGPSSTNMSRVLQAVIPTKRADPNNPLPVLQQGDNLIEGEILSGSGSLRVNSMAIFWQAS